MELKGEYWLNLNIGEGYIEVHIKGGERIVKRLHKETEEIINGIETLDLVDQYRPKTIDVQHPINVRGTEYISVRLEGDKAIVDKYYREIEEVIERALKEEKEGEDDNK